MPVARSTRAWIETFVDVINRNANFVARSTRAWIETRMSGKSFRNRVSHALRVRGLKPARNPAQEMSWQSHALRVRGLKPAFPGDTIQPEGRTLYACVD